jgi:hypothetical protein
VNGKRLKGNEIRFAQVATGLSPADFPVGSLESRAIARAVLEYAEGIEPQIPQADQDALTLYRGVGYLNATMQPSYSELERTEVYERGQELSEETAISPSNYLQSGSGAVATRTFHLGFGRNPASGDLLRFSDVEVIQAPAWYVWTIRNLVDAWTRRFQPCHVRWE